ncbi:hypothetical protein D3C87_1393850 [compost metagenome]
MTDVADLLAQLIPELRDLHRVHGVAGDEGHLGFAGAGERHDAFVFAGFHQLLFDAFGDLARDFLGGRSRPVGANHHGLEGERRILALAELGVGKCADNGQQQHQEQDDLAITQRPFGNVEAHRGLLLVRQIDHAIGAIHRAHLLPFEKHMNTGGHHPVAGVEPF